MQPVGVPSVLNIGLGLLAFIVALYALTARDQRAPYFTNTAYGMSLALLLSAALAIVLPRLPRSWVIVATIVHSVSDVLFILVLILLIRTIARLRFRRIHLRDDYRLSNFWLGRVAKRLFRKKPSYAHDPAPWPVELRTEIAKIPSVGEKIVSAYDTRSSVQPKGSPTVTVTIDCTTTAQANQGLIPLVLAFVRTGHLVQYMSCGRHPIDFMMALREECLKEDLWGTDRSQRITAIDAYTPHFGFTDSIHEVMLGELRDWGIVVIPSGPSYAGMHTASAKAFNRGRKVHKEAKGSSSPRLPTLVIYEGARELVDLESAEQYRIFLRHVMPSEQLWGGMLTVFVEYDPPENDRGVLKAYSHVYLTKRQAGAIGETA